MADMDSGLAGTSVLLIEDEALLLLQLHRWLHEMGCNVSASAGRLCEAMHLCETLTVDVALIDMNLHGESSVQPVRFLQARGMPFVLTSGFDRAVLPQDLQESMLVKKPYRKRDIEKAIRQALAKP